MHDIVCVIHAVAVRHVAGEGDDRGVVDEDEVEGEVEEEGENVGD